MLEKQEKAINKQKVVIDMLLLANTGSTSLQEIGNKIISVGMPILIGIAVTIRIVMVGLLWYCW